MFNWVPGRQAGSYEKMPLLPHTVSKLLNVDAYLLRFPAGCSVIRHRDPVAAGYRHYRINIKLCGHADDVMYIEGPIKRWGRAELFEPDKYFHGLVPIKQQMYMLSFGRRVRV